MKLIDSGLELRIFRDVILEGLLVMRSGSNREISGLGAPVCLAFRRYQEFHEFPYSLLFCLVSVIKSPQRSSFDGYASLIVITYLREVCRSDLKLM
jgi:hypothetical protein